MDGSQINWQVSWGVFTILIAVLGFFIKMWINGIKTDILGVKTDIAEIKADLKEKADTEICRRIHEGVDKMLHRHAVTGASGEAVYK
jgi:hypothetical protein